MTKNEIMKEFLSKTAIPVGVALVLFFFFKAICTKDGATDYLMVCLLCGIPIGIRRMALWLVPRGAGWGIGGTLAIWMVNFFIGGLIGMVVLAWRLSVAVWYLCLTIYRMATLGK